MTMTMRPPSQTRTILAKVFAWHRPLMIVAALMVISAVISAIGLLVDPREILGQRAWGKPLKFSVSILLYVVTWAWLIAHLPRWRRAAGVLGTIIAVAMTIEQVAIVWAASTGTTSHFNVSDGIHTTVWAVMGTAVTVMYLCTLVTTIAAFFIRMPAPSITVALRAGTAIGLAGLGVAYFMVVPTDAQLSMPSGVVGAHSVGVADGGNGLPILGWSTTGGDFRVPHFIGMHALQILPLFAISLNALGRRVRILRSPRTQMTLVVTASIVFGAAFVLLTVQAASGESVIAPSPFILAAAGGLVVATASTVAVAVVAGRERTSTDKE